jgi:hypothetical protein
MRQLKVLTQLLLTKKQKFLIKFQRNNIIDSSSSGTSDEGQLNIIDLMKSKNEKHKEMINKKINENIQSFKNKDLKEIDVRVINGIVKKRFSDDDYVDNSEEEDSCEYHSHSSSRECTHYRIIFRP